MRKNLSPYHICLILGLALVVLTYNINKPFIGHHDWNGAFWGSVARNYLGELQRLSSPTHEQTLDLLHSNQVVYYSDYTPVMPLLFTLSALVFGLSEASLRLVTVCFSLLLIFFIYKIGSYLYGRQVGLAASVFTLLTPMFIYFGKLPDHEPIVTALISGAFYFYLSGSRSSPRRGWFLTFLAAALAESWSAYFLIPFLIIHQHFFDRRRYLPVKKVLVTAVTILALHLLFLYHFNGINGINVFLRSGISRVNVFAPTTDSTQFTLPQFLLTEARYAVIYFTRALLILSGLWFGRLFFLRKKRQNLFPELALLVLVLPAVSFIVIFNKLAYIHDYKLYLFLPFISLSAARVAINGISHLSRLVQNWVALRNGARWFQGGLFILVMVLVGTERLVYLRTLLATSFNQPGYELGLLLKELTHPNEISFINSGQFKAFYGVFIDYYANRQTAAGDLTLDELTRNPTLYRTYRYLVLIDGRTTDQKLESHLLQNFPHQKYSSYTFVDVEKL